MNMNNNLIILNQLFIFIYKQLFNNVNNVFNKEIE